MRVVAPTELDPAWLADGVVRNNMGFGGLVLQARARLEEQAAVLEPTGQRLRLERPAAPAPAAWRRFEVLQAGDPARTALRELPGAPGP